MASRQPPTAPLSALIITKNEELHIERCVKSLHGWVEQIVVVDDFSTDRTVDLAKRHGCEVVQHRFEHPAQQKNWALRNVAWRHDWLLMLDADEMVPTSLRDEIVTAVATTTEAGYWMRYRLMFYGRWIRHAGWYPVWILRLVRHKQARFEDRSVDEHVILDGPAGFLQNDLIHESLRDLSFWIAKHNVYSTRNVLEQARRRDAADRLTPRLWGHQAERKRFLKERIWPYLPFRGVLFFIYLYIFRLGFLDGRQGFVFCMMHGVFQSFISVKQWEHARFKQGAPEGAIRAPRLSPGEGPTVCTPNAPLTPDR